MGCQGDATSPSVPVGAVTVSVRDSVLVMGDRTQATATVRDTEGNPLDITRVNWKSSLPAVATVSDKGIVSTLSPGTAIISGSRGGVTGAATVSVLPNYAVGQVVVAGDRPASGTGVTLRTLGTPHRSYSGTVDAADSFRILLPVQPDPLRLTADAATGARIFHPVRSEISAAEASQPLRPLLIPHEETLTAGSYAPAAIPLSLNDAFTSVCADKSDAQCNSFYPNAWLGLSTGPALWPEPEFPLPVAFNRPGSTDSISVDDSIAVWLSLRQLEADVGRTMFRPAELNSLPPPSNGFTPHAILISVDSTLSGSWGYANWASDAAGNLVTAKVRIIDREALHFPNLLAHELLHTLGFHHTCAWASVMGGYGCRTEPRASATDAAAFALAYEVLRAVRTEAPTTGLVDALEGERVLELGLSWAREQATPSIAVWSARQPELLFGIPVQVSRAP